MPKSPTRQKPSQPRVIASAQEPDAIILPTTERGLSPGLVARFDRLKRKLARTDLKPRQREAAIDELAALLHDIQEQPVREAVLVGIAETIDLAKLRDEDVKVDKRTGAVRIMSRGGLRQAYEDGHLDNRHGPVRTDDLWEAGRRYRDCYEAVEGLTASQKGGGGGFGPKGPQPRVLEAGDQLKQMRAALTQRQTDVLDLVCGQDMRLRTAADELGRGFLGAKNSLRGGLAILAGLKIERRPLAELIQMQTAAIAAAAKWVA